MQITTKHLHISLKRECERIFFKKKKTNDHMIKQRLENEI